MNDFILDPKKKYLLALSGGVDSSVLFHILASNKYEFRVVHFNHHTRGCENELDLQHVVELCRQYNISYDVCDYTHKGGNFQAKAREYRLSTYKSLVEKYSLDGVVLAHHGDDQIENIMMLDNKIGTVLMSAEKIIDELVVYRPLLKIYKSQLYEYARKHDINYNEDSSNDDVKYLRNYYRKQNKYTITEKNFIINLQAEREKYYEKITSELGDKITKSYYTNFEDSYLLLYLFCKKYVDQNVSVKLLAMIIKSIDFQGHKSFSLPGGHYLIQSYDYIYISKVKQVDFETKQKLVVGLNNFNGIEFENKIEQGMIRTRNQNDKIALKKGSKKVTRVMIDMKIDRIEREIWPVVVDDNDNVLYIPKRIKK